MSDETSARLGLPLLQAGQAQKEMTVNEALTRLDLAVQARVTAIGVDDPPADAEVGDCWIVGAAPTGDWAGMAGALAGWTADGWRFVAPGEGMMAWVTTDAATARYHDGVWELGAVRAERVLIGGRQVLGEQCAAITGAEGGAVIDDGARATVAQILVALRSHGLIAT
ncbi:DUF2793 domain-containing protein [Sphingomonas koreensis]|nr:DUF2793 domain-containing protein [Sphingomonas koreensis]